MSENFISSENRPDVTASLVAEPLAFQTILDSAIYSGLLRNGSPIISLQTYTPDSLWQWVHQQPELIATSLTLIADDKKDGSDGSEASEGSEAKEGKDDSGTEEKEGSDGSEGKEACDTDPAGLNVRSFYRVLNAFPVPAM